MIGGGGGGGGAAAAAAAADDDDDVHIFSPASGSDFSTTSIFGLTTKQYTRKQLHL
jgi:hypothetical protein